MGVDNATTAAYLGFGLHILTGTVGNNSRSHCHKAEGNRKPVQEHAGWYGLVSCHMAGLVPSSNNVADPAFHPAHYTIDRSQFKSEDTTIKRDEPIPCNGRNRCNRVSSALGRNFGFIMRSMIRIRARRIDHTTSDCMYKHRDLLTERKCVSLLFDTIAYTSYENI